MIQTKTSHVRFEFKSLEIRKQHEKFKKTFRFIIDETKNAVSKKTIEKVVSKNINFTKSLIELRIVLKILQKFNQLAQKRMIQAAKTIIVNAEFDDNSKEDK